MTTQIEFKDAVNHMFSYAFGSINRHMEEQMKTKQTPYSLYMKEQHEVLKKSIPDISQRSKTISSQWKNVDKKTKEDFKEKAENYVPDKNDKKEHKRKGGLNNFQLFCKIERDNFVPKDKDEKKQSTRELSNVWKNVSDDKKKEYKKAAEQYNENHEDYSELVKKFSNGENPSEGKQKPNKTEDKKKKEKKSKKPN